MKKTLMQKIKLVFNASLLILSVLFFSLLLWYLFGLIVPDSLIKMSSQDAESLNNLSLLGGAFGGANALFSSMALFLLIISVWLQQKELTETRKELEASANAQIKMAASQQEALELQKIASEEQRKAQKEMVELQAQALALQVIMPFMDEISSDEMRRSIIKLADYKRENEAFASDYESLINARKAGIIDDSQLTRLEEIDQARRKFVMIFHRMYKLKKTDVVSDKIVKVVIGSDHVKLLLENVEPLEAKIRSNYSRDIFVFASSLYSKKELDEKGSHG